MSQNKIVTTEETSFSTSTSFSSNLDKLQHKKVLSYLNKRLGNSDLKKEDYEIWLVQNKKDELYEIRLYRNEIKVDFKSKVYNSSSEKDINKIIDDISTIVNPDSNH